MMHGVLRLEKIHEEGKVVMEMAGGVKEHSLPAEREGPCPNSVGI